MNIIDSYMLQGIFYYLDTHSLQECCIVSKEWKEIIKKDSFWKSKFQKRSSSSFHSGPYFKFLDYKSYLDHLDIEKFSFDSLKPLAQKLANPQNLEIINIQASSEDHDQVARNILEYDEFFWSSVPSESKNTDEFLICELARESLIYRLSFKTYRALYQEGTIYPPKFAKLSIGNTKDCSDYETDEFEVGLTENYNTILILPKLISGKFVKLHLLGKQSQEPGTEKWYTVLRFLEIIGHPVEEFSPDPLLKKCMSGKFEEISKPLSPFYVERLEKFGMLELYLNHIEYLDTDTISYLYQINKDKIEKPELKLRYCEILGNYFFDKKEYEMAKNHYSRILDIWGYTKVCILTKQFQNVRHLMSENNSRRPGLVWVLNVARTVGGPELEATVAAEFSS